MARGRSSGRRSDYEWQGNTGAASLASNVPAIINMVVNNAAGTLMRSRGQVLGSIDGATDGDAVAVAVGLIIADDDAVAVGVTAIPSPDADMDAEWLWHGFLLLKAQGTSTDQPGLTARLEIDSKAMRRLKPNTNCVFAIAPKSLSGTPAVDVLVGLRSLLAR